jgi:hypothetical protein
VNGGTVPFSQWGSAEEALKKEFAAGPDGVYRQQQGEVLYLTKSRARPHRCNNRLEDVIQALFEGNPLLTVGRGTTDPVLHSCVGCTAVLYRRVVYTVMCTLHTLVTRSTYYTAFSLNSDQTAVVSSPRHHLQRRPRY